MKHSIKKIIPVLLGVAVIFGLFTAAYGQEGETSQDFKDYLYEVPEGASTEEMLLLLNRNNAILEDMESFFTEESMKEYQKAFSKFRQNKNTATAQDANAVTDVLVQVKSAADNIFLLWDGQEMPVTDPSNITEESVDKGRRQYAYGYAPRLLLYPAEDPYEAKGNVLILFRNHSGDAVEGHPAAYAYQEMGYNVFGLVMRSGPYSDDDGAMDVQRGIRVAKSVIAERGYGGADMIAVASWGGAGLAEQDLIYNFYGEITPAEYVDGYEPDEIDAISSDFDVAIMIYSAFKSFTEVPAGEDAPSMYILKRRDYNPHLPAMYIAAGTEDATGRYEDSLAFYEEMKDRTDCQLTIMEGAGHGFGIGQEGAAYVTEDCKNQLPEADAFMQAHRGYQD